MLGQKKLSAASAMNKLEPYGLIFKGNEQLKTE
jgi:hypothetical protein